MPFIRNNPDKLHLSLTNGSLVASGADSMSWEYRYTLNIVIDDYDSDPDFLMAQVILWLGTAQPDAINNPTLREKLFTFDSNNGNGKVADISLRLQLTERVLLSADGSEPALNVLPEPDRPQEMWAVRHP